MDSKVIDIHCHLGIWQRHGIAADVDQFEDNEFSWS